MVDEVAEEHATACARGRAAVARSFEMAERDPVSMRFILNAKHREFLRDERLMCSAKPFVTLRDIVAEGIENKEIREMDFWVAASCTFGPALRMIG